MEFKGTHGYPENRRETRLLNQFGIPTFLDGNKRRYFQIGEIPMTDVIREFSIIEQLPKPSRSTERTAASLSQIIRARRLYDMQYMKGYVDYDDI